MRMLHNRWATTFRNARPPRAIVRDPRPSTCWPTCPLVSDCVAIATLHVTSLAQPLQFTQAQVVAADTEFFPDLPSARAVALPDDWAVSRPDQSGPVWYRVTFDAEARAPAAS